MFRFLSFPKRIFVWAYLVLVGGMLFVWFRRWAYDDPFITYRYAYNIMQGNGFVYNPDLKVLSTTTPLFALLLAGLGLIFDDLPLLANFVGIASLMLGAYFLWDISRTWKSSFVGWTALLLYPTFPLLITTLGSETLFYLMLCLGAIAMYARRKYTLTAILAGLAVLARADALLVPVLLGFDYLVQLFSKKPLAKFLKRRKKIPWISVLVFVGILIAWFGFAWVYFGSPLPVTLSAKQSQGNMAISTRFAPGIVRVMKWYVPRWQYWVELILAFIGVLYAIAKKRRWLLLLVWTALYFIAYTILGVSSYFWYYAPLIPGFIVAVGLGVDALWQILNKKKTFPNLKQAAASRVVFVPLIIVVFVAQVVHLNRTRYFPDRRYAIYHAAGEWLAEHTSPDASVGALEVGIIGFYAKRTMVDFAGLIQPDVMKVMDVQTTYEDTASWAVQKYNPDYVVLFPGALPKLENSLVMQYCEDVMEFDKEQYNAPGNLVIFKCSWEH